MSHFTVLVIGENAEAQLLPYKESPAEDGSDGFPTGILAFEDSEAEYRKKFDKEKTETWYPERSCNINKSQYEMLKRSKGEEVALKIEEVFAILYAGKRHELQFWEEPKTKTGKRKLHSIYVEVVEEKRVMREPQGSGSYVFATVKKIKGPDKISFKEKYKTFEAFMKEYCGYTERDPKANRYGYWSNPQAKWDWYELGGRWTGFFTLKNGTNGIIGRPGLMTEPAQGGTADKARIKNIDFKAMTDEAEQKAIERYDKLCRLLGVKELPKIEPWSVFIDDKGKYKKWNIDARREAYHSQPIKQKIKELSRDESLSEDDRSLLSWLDYEDYMVGRDEYIRLQKLEAFSTFAVVKDGKWYERGKMGWWACVSDEKETEAWTEEFTKLIEGLPEDTMLSVYDCHI